MAVLGTLGPKGTGLSDQLDCRKFLDIETLKNNSTIYDNLGIPLVNRFACLLQGPKGKIAQLDSKPEWLNFQVLSVDCPGISINTNDSELNGVNRYYFKGRSYDDLQITFLETSELTLRDYFALWMKEAVHIDTVNGGVERRYITDIVAENFFLAPLDYKGIARRGDRFRGVFPIKIQDINYNYATAGEIVKTTVTFKYMFHEVETVHESGDSSHISTK